MDVGNEFGLVGTYLPQHIIAIRLVMAGFFGAMIGFEERCTRVAQGCEPIF